MADYHRLNATKHGLSYTPSYHNWYKYKDATGLSLKEYIHLHATLPPDRVLKVIDGKLVPLSRADATRLQRMRCDNNSGFSGVSYIKKRGNYRWDVMVQGEKIGKAGFATEYEAAAAREQFLIDNNIIAKRNFN